MRRSVLDLGSNSFHVLVADVSDEGYIDPVARERQMLHLGRAVAEHGAIPDDLADVAVEAVAHLTELARRRGADQRHAVATSALRDASNGPAIIARMEEVADAPIRVIPGTEEARLSYLGVRAAMGVSPGGLAVLDLGGGSLELAVGAERIPDLVTSTNLGVSRLSALVHDDPMSKADRARLREAIAREIALSGGAFATRMPLRVVAVGGTVRALARVLAAEDHVWTPSTLNRFEITTARLAEVRDELRALDRSGRAEIPGMKARRADHAHIAATILVEVLEQLRVERFEVCDWGLREGVLLDEAGTQLAPAPDVLREREVRRLRESFRPDVPHGPHLRHLATQLFEGTRELHGLGDADREMLQHVAMVHDVGAALALRRHQKHAAYVVEHAELRGFDPRAYAQLVTMVRYQVSRGIDRRFPAASMLSSEQRDRSAVLLALLQAAEGLDLTRDQSVTDVDVDIDEDNKTITLLLHGTDLQLLQGEVARRTAMFRRVFDRELEVHTLGAS